jgi:hypothetical protein
MGMMGGNTAIHDGTSTAGMDTSKGLVSALGGQDMHPMQFTGAEIQPVQSGSSIALQEQGGWGLRTWASHHSAIGYRRRGQFGGGVGGSGSGGGGGSGSSVVVIPAVSPEFDSGMNDGTDGQELERLENFYSGAEENPTSAQSAPTPRAEQQVVGVNGDGNVPGNADGGGSSYGSLDGQPITTNGPTWTPGFNPYSGHGYYNPFAGWYWPFSWPFGGDTPDPDAGPGPASPTYT